MTQAGQQIAQAMTLARQGDRAAARRMLLPLANDSADAATVLAWIERDSGDEPAERAALVTALRADSRHLGALLARGDLERRGGDDRAAARFFRTALNVANATPPPQSYHPALRDAQQFVAAAQQRFAETLSQTLRQTGLDDGNAPPRVGQAIDLLLGRRELYQQQPSMFFFPGVAQRPFFERGEFAWASAVEAATDAIRAELQAMLAERDGFTPYVVADPASPAPANHLLGDPDWGALHLMEGGRPHPANAARFPAAMAALAHAPQPAIGTRSPMALFSRLRPGTHIKPHHGVFNTRLICHLPLIVPDGCAIRVGAETRSWREGELLILDDSFEHEAWNRGASDRVVMLFEIWRPDIDADERAAITVLLGAVERHGIAAEA